MYWCNFNQGKAPALPNWTRKPARSAAAWTRQERRDPSGQINRLITKPKITAFGLNWQHCAHTVFFPTFSYEQYYQAIRRFWRRTDAPSNS